MLVAISRFLSRVRQGAESRTLLPFSTKCSASGSQRASRQPHSALGIRLKSDSLANVNRQPAIQVIRHMFSKVIRTAHITIYSVVYSIVLALSLTLGMANVAHAQVTATVTADKTEVVRGENVTFTLTVPSSPGFDTDIDFTLTGSVDQVTYSDASGTQRTRSRGAGNLPQLKTRFQGAPGSPTTLTINVQTSSAGTSPVTITLTSTLTTQVVLSQSSITVPVTAPPPTVTINAVNATGIAFENRTQFRLLEDTTDPFYLQVDRGTDTTSAITVNVSVSQNHGMGPIVTTGLVNNAATCILGSGTVTASFPDVATNASTSGTVTIPVGCNRAQVGFGVVSNTDDDTAISSLFFQAQAGTGYELAANLIDIIGSLRIHDNDPVMSVAAATGTPMVTEGDSFNVTIEAGAAVTHSHLVTLRVTADPGNHIGGVGKNYNATIAAGATSANVTIPTKRGGGAGTATLEIVDFSSDGVLLGNGGYRKNSVPANRLVTATIAANPAQFSVWADATAFDFTANATIAENATSEHRVGLEFSPSLLSNSSLRLQIETKGAYLAATGTRGDNIFTLSNYTHALATTDGADNITVTFPTSGGSSLGFSIALDDDSDFEEDGYMIITALPPDASDPRQHNRYRLTDNTSRRSVTLNFTSNEPRPKPRLAVVCPEYAVTGATITCQINRSGDYGFLSNTSFALGSNGFTTFPPMVTFPAGNDTTSIEFNATVAGTAGATTNVILNANAAYEIATAQADINVVTSLATLPSGPIMVDEGDNLTIPIGILVAQASDTQVRWATSNAGMVDFVTNDAVGGPAEEFTIDGGTLDTTTGHYTGTATILAGNTNTNLTLRARNNRIYELFGRNRHLNLTANFTIGSSDNGVVERVAIDDATPTPEFALSVPSASAGRGSNITFTLTNTNNVVTRVDNLIEVDIDGEANFYDIRLDGDAPEATVGAMNSSTTFIVETETGAGAANISVAIRTSRSNPPSWVGQSGNDRASIIVTGPGPALPNIMVAEGSSDTIEIGLVRGTETGAVTLNWRTENVTDNNATAGSGNDYIITGGGATFANGQYSGSVTIPAGNNNFNLTITAANNNIFEGGTPRAFKLVANATVGTEATAAETTAILVDDDPAPRLGIFAPSHAPRGDNITIALAITNGIQSRNNIDVFLTGNGGWDGSLQGVERDQDAAPGTHEIDIIYPALTTANHTFNAIAESGASVSDIRIRLAASTAVPAGYTRDEGNRRIVVRIVFDGFHAPSDLTVFEGGSRQYQVTILPVNATANRTVNLTVTDITAVAGTDYTALPAQVTILAGNENANVTITASDNDALDGDRTFNITATLNDAMRAPVTTEVTIMDDEDGATAIGVRGVKGSGFSGGSVIFNEQRVADIFYEDIDDFMEFEVYRHDTSGTAAIPFSYQVSQTGSYLASNSTATGVQTATLPANMNVTRVRLYIDDDSTAEDRGRVTFTLIKTPDSVILAGDAGARTYVVADDERPEVAVSYSNPDDISAFSPTDAPLLPDGTPDLRAHRLSIGGNAREGGNWLFGLNVRPVETVVDVTVRVTRNGPLFAGEQRVTTHVISLNGSDSFRFGGSDVYRNLGLFAPGALLHALNITIPSNNVYDGTANSITAEVVDMPHYNPWGTNGSEITTQFAPDYNAIQTVVVADDGTVMAPEIDIMRIGTGSGEGINVGEFDLAEVDANFASEIVISVDGTNMSAATGSFKLNFVAVPMVSGGSQPATIGDSCATAGTDFVDPDRTFMVPPNSGNITFDLTPYICRDNTVDDSPREVFDITISEVRNLRMSTRGFSDEVGGTFKNRGLAEIFDLDPLITLAEGPTRALEGSNVTYSFTSNVAPATGRNFTIPINIVGRSINGTPPTSVMFKAGETEVNVTLALNFNGSINTAEAVDVSISEPSLNDFTGSSTDTYWWNATANRIVTQVVDAQLSFEIVPTTVTVTEGGMAEFVLTLGTARTADTGDLNVTYFTGDGTANSSHYTAVGNTTLNFAVGDVNKTISFNTTNNDVVDGTRQFNVTAVAHANGGATNLTQMGFVVIEDDDGALPLAFVPPSLTVSEGDAARLNITIGEPANETLTVRYYTSDDSALAGTHYTGVNTTVTFNVGEVNKTIAIPTTENNVDDDTMREFMLTAVASINDGATNITTTARVTINDDDAAPALGVRGQSNIAPERNATYTIFTTGDVVSSDNLTVMVQVNGSVTAIYNGTDTIMHGSGSNSTDVMLVLPARATSVPLVVTAGAIENETISIGLMTGTGYTINADNGRVEAIVREGLTFAPTSLTVNEGDTANFTLTIIGDETRTTPLAVTYYTSDDTALAGTDYTAENETVTFAAGVSNRTIRIATTDDNVDDDSPRRFTLTATAMLDGDEVMAMADVMITDDDDAPMLRVQGPRSVARGRNATYRVMTGDVVSSENLTVQVEVNGSVTAIYNGSATPIVPTPVVRVVQVGGINVAQATNTSTTVNVTLPAMARSVPLVVTAADEVNATISVRVLANTAANYTVNPDVAQQMMVTRVREPGFDAGKLTRAILPQVVVTMLDEAGAAISSRVQDSFGDSNLVGVRGQRGLRINNQPADEYAVDTLAGIVRSEATREANENPWDAPDAASRESLLELPDAGALSYTLDFNRGERGGIAVWGQGFNRNIDGESGDVKFDGTVPGSVAGVDARVTQNLLAGVGFSSVAAEFDYDTQEDGEARKGEYEAELTAVHPYVGYRTEGGGNVWATLGIGEGEVTIDQNTVDSTYVGEVELQSWGLGFTTLRETGQQGRGHDVTLNYHGDVQMATVEETPTARTRDAFPEAGTTEVDVGRARLGASLSQSFALDGGGVFEQSLDLALRHDSGDLAEGGAVEIGGALGLDLPAGLRLDLSARTLIFHEESVDDWGVRGGLAWVTQPGYGGRGLSLSLTPEWGNVASRGDALLAGGVDAVTAGSAGSVLGNGEGDAGASYGFDVRYGIPLLRDGLLTPYVAGDAGDADSTIYGGAYNFGGFAAGVETQADDADAGNAFIRYQLDF